MKNYGNFVSKYVSAEQAKKYKPIVAKDLVSYQKAQLADLERFLKDDFRIVKNRDNPGDYKRNVMDQKKRIEAEIARLKGQLGIKPQSS